MPKQPSMLTRQVIVDGLRYLLAGKLRLKHSHLPAGRHTIPAHFIGICVATNQYDSTDDYVLAQLKALGLQRVRLDIAQDDMYPHQTRLLQRLLDAGVQVDVHLVQPFVAAAAMPDNEAQMLWQRFVTGFLASFASRIASIEIGNTLNRKRWAGYHWPGFLVAWQLAYQAARVYGVKVVGPNIQDFEPLYNISALKQLGMRNMLPDVQSNNLFVERVIEPEQPDHRIFKFRWTRCLKFNLIKKARLLQKVGADFGVPALVSPVAFWAIYRIQRILPEGAEKQADYLTRYFTLLAASGALQQANWGAMICQREGVINDGLPDAEYPALERVAYYRSVDGNPAQYAANPSFAALKTVAYWLNGATYLEALATGQGLEIHCLQHHGKLLHVAWTINGGCVELRQLYRAEDLHLAEAFDRDGAHIPLPGLITEKPIYLTWPHHTHLRMPAAGMALSDVRIHAHIPHLQYFPVAEGDWRGMILATDAAQAAQLWQAWHPERLHAPEKSAALRHARNAIWSLPDPRQPGSQVTVKQPVKMHLHKQYLDRFKPSKAKRSWNGAMELMRRGIDTAPPVAFFEKKADLSLKQNFYLCAFVTHDFSIAKPFIAFSEGEQRYAGLSPEQLYQAFARFCHRMHASGIYFRDFSAGNILVSQSEGELRFSLIDTARLRTFPLSTPMKYRLADLTRALNKLYWPGRTQFLRQYLALSGQTLTTRTLIPFYLYDFKVTLKRTIGRKGIKKLLRKIKSWRGS